MDVLKINNDDENNDKIKDIRYWMKGSGFVLPSAV